MTVPVQEIVGSPPPEASLLELYKLARSQIEHENTLVGQRITWFLTFQGLLFAALFVAIRLFDANKFPAPSPVRTNLAIAVVLMCLIGAASALVCLSLIRAAYAQHDAVAEWWNNLNRSPSQFPRIAGTGGFNIGTYRVTGADFLFVVFLIWVAFIGLFAHAAYRVAYPLACSDALRALHISTLGVTT